MAEAFGEDELFGSDDEGTFDSQSTPSAPAATTSTTPKQPPTPKHDGPSSTTKSQAPSSPSASTTNDGRSSSLSTASNGETKTSDRGSQGGRGGRARLPSTGQANQVFWKEHAEWQRQVLRNDWHGTVNNPLSHGSMMKKWVTYEVTLQPMGYQVRRRYSDFTWLYGVLQARYVGVLIPPLPPKEGMMSKKGFLKIRMRALQIFVNKLVLNPYLRSDSAVMDFFSVAEAKAWATTKKSVIKEQKLIAKKNQSLENASAAASAGAKQNIGVVKWNEAIDAYELPDNTDSKIIKVQQQVAVLERLMKKVIVSSNKLVQKSHSYASEMGEFNVSFQALVHTEQATSVHSTDKLNSAELTQILSKMGFMFSSWHEVLKFQPGVNQMLLHQVLSFELQMVQSLQDLFKQRQTMIKAYQNAQSQLSNSELKQQAAQTRGKHDQAKKLDKNIEAAQISVRKCKYVVDFMTKGLFYSELERFVSDKVTAFREMMAMFAAAHQAYAERLAEQWKLSLDSISDQVDANVSKTYTTSPNLFAKGHFD